MVVLLALAGCESGAVTLQDAALSDARLSYRDSGSGEARPPGDAQIPDRAVDAGPPAEPFGTWPATCSASPYPNETANAYPTGFQQAVADDWVYIAWVWRLSGDAATNHSVSAMKSKDMKTWLNLCGALVSLPVTPSSPTVIDPVPTQSGLLNSHLVLSFDGQKRPLITYHKHVDKRLADGSTRSTTQAFNARWDGTSGTIYQITSWDSLYVFGGGGSLPASDTSISFSGVQVGPSGALAQRLSRSQADDAACKAVEDAGGECSAFPKTGTWALQDSSKGLALRQPLVAVSAAALASPDPFENPPTAALSVGAVENAPLSSDPAAAKWVIRTKMSRAEVRWITLRADFDGDGSNNPGLFDRYNSRFSLDAGGANKTFRFGAQDGLFWPLTGDWDSDGVTTIGVHSPVTLTTHLKNDLAGGTADATLSGPIASVPKIADSPLKWHTVNPAARYAIKWEVLPTNRDCPYDCQGVPLVTATGCQPNPTPCLDSARMSSNLYLFEYDEASKTWNKSLIDRAWGGSAPGFDFLTFKNVQLVLYYGADRYARIAQRARQGGSWSAWAITTLDTRFGGWDGHNYLTMTIDTNHEVHLSGNMHASALVYFRGTGYLGDAAPLTYTKLGMTGANESQTTYPQFLRSPTGELLFTYRSGSSGNGDTFVDRYDERARSWTPLHVAGGAAVPLFRGR